VAQLQVQPVKVLPLTDVAWFAQSEGPQLRVQFGGLLKPARHPAQSLLALKPEGQTPQEGPRQ
jgi:hypothetical protein